MHNPGELQRPRRRPAARRKRPRRFRLRLTECLGRKCLPDLRKFQKNWQNIRNPIPDTTLRANVYHTFRARLYASKFANATGARSGK
jgi:hypothetical protein